MNRVAAGMADRTPALAASGEVIRGNIRERFETETAPDGTPWEDWAESYRDYAEAYPNIGILQQSGELVEAASDAGAIHVTNDTVFYRTDVLPHYGLAHHTGLPERRTPLPARPFLDMSPEAEALIVGTFFEWFEGNLDLFVTAGGGIGRRHAVRGEGGAFISREAAGLPPL